MKKHMGKRILAIALAALMVNSVIDYTGILEVNAEESQEAVPEEAKDTPEEKATEKEGSEEVLNEDASDDEKSEEVIEAADEAAENVDSEKENSEQTDAVKDSKQGAAADEQQNASDEKETPGSVEDAQNSGGGKTASTDETPEAAVESQVQENAPAAVVEKQVQEVMPVIADVPQDEEQETDESKEVVTATWTPEPESLSLEDGALPDNAEALEGYFQEQLFGDNGIALFGTSGRDSLKTEVDKKIYDLLKAEIEKVAAGTETSTVFTLPLSLFGLDTDTWYSTSDLGVEWINKKNEKNETEWNQDALEAMYKKAAYDHTAIFHALLNDCPYDMYWFTKDSTLEDAALWGGFGVQAQTWSDGTQEVSFEKNTTTITFTVDAAYRDGDSKTATNAAKTSAAVTAAENAKEIAKKYDGKSVYEKVCGYKEEICNLVSYNYDALDNGYQNSGNPWQLIYVFDGDENTKVVCEGYSKAFQYLCDLGNVTCYTVTGTMTGGTGAGGHMWNIVPLDGANYLVDVTNSDTGSVGQNGGLFLAGTTTGSANTNYTFKTGNQSIVYEYDEDTTSIYSTAQLTLASSDYSPKSKTELTEAMVTLNGTPKEYDGKAADLAVLVTVKTEEKELTKDIDYTVTIKNGDQTVDEILNAGTYTIVVAGIGDYTGSVEKTYTVTPKNVAADMIGSIEDQYYTGSAVVPNVTVTDGEKTLAAEADYELSYSDNTETGNTAKVTISGKGNYTGTADKTFTIKKIDAPTDYLAGTKGNETYYRSDVVIAKDGWQVSDDNGASWKDSITVSDEGAFTKAMIFKQTDTGYISSAVTVTFTIDKTAPTGTVTIDSKVWDKFLTFISFGHYKVTSKEVTITNNETEMIQYLLTDQVYSGEQTAENYIGKAEGWMDYTSTSKPSILENQNQIVYAKLTDQAGNTAYISSDAMFIDNTAPVLEILPVAADDIKDTSFIFQMKSNEAGTYYYVVLASNETEPTAAGIIASQNDSDKIKGNGKITADSAVTITVTGLKPMTGYKVYACVVDDALNLKDDTANGNTSDVTASDVITTKQSKLEGTVSISGKAVYGETLTAKADVTTADPGILTYTWYANMDGTEEQVGTGEFLTLDQAKYISAFITVKVTAEKCYGVLECEIDDDPNGCYYVLKAASPTDYKPQNGKVNDEKGTDTFTFTGKDGVKYQYCMNNNGDWHDVTMSGTTGTISVGNINLAAGVLQVRAKETEVYLAGEAITNDKAFTASLEGKVELISSSGEFRYEDTLVASVSGQQYGAVLTCEFIRIGADGKETTVQKVDGNGYTLQSEDIGTKFKVIVTAEGYSGRLESSVTPVIKKKQAPESKKETYSYRYTTGSDGETTAYVKSYLLLPSNSGTTSYSVSLSDADNIVENVSVSEDGELKYTVPATDKDNVGKTATITVTVSMANYEDTTFTLTIRISDKKTVKADVQLNGYSIVYGEKISELTFWYPQFTDTITGKEVEGTLSWKDPDLAPDAGKTDAEWIFVPNDSEYEEVTGKIEITVEQATPQVEAPTADEITYDPNQTYADIELKYTTPSIPGTWSWANYLNTPTADDQTQMVIFTPDDKNYKELWVEIPVTVKQAIPKITKMPTTGTITYGMPITDCELNGGEANVPGWFWWGNADYPQVSDSNKTEYTVIFRPNDGNWATVEMKVTVTVLPAELTLDASDITVLTKMYDRATDAYITGDLKLSGVVVPDEDDDDDEDEEDYDEEAYKAAYEEALKEVGFTYTDLKAAYADAEVGTDKDVFITVNGASITNNNYVLADKLVDTVKGSIQKTTDNIKQPSLGDNYRLVMGEKDKAEVTPELAENPNLNTQEKIVDHMKSLLGEKQLNGKTPEKQNMAVYDVLLLNKAANGSWDRATDDNFPAAGVTVTIPYPEGTNASDYAFLAMHMLTMSRTGSDGKQYSAGDVEIPTLTLTDDGIEMTLNSLSPIALSWAKVDKTAENPNDQNKDDQNKDNQNSQITPGDQNKNDQNSQNTTTDQKNTSKKKHKHSGSSSSTSESAAATATAASSDAVTVTSAKTNDSNAPVFWAMLALVSVMAAGVVIYRRRKENTR